MRNILSVVGLACVACASRTAGSADDESSTGSSGSTQSDDASSVTGTLDAGSTGVGTRGSTDASGTETTEGSDSSTGGDAEFSEPVIIELEDLSGEVEFDVPAGALGFDIALFNEAQGQFGPRRLISPADELVMDAFQPAGGSFASGLGYDGIATTAVPQGFLEGEVPALDGTWRAEFATTDPNASALIQIQRTSNAEFHGGVLDLHLHIAEGLVIQSPSAAHEVGATTAGDDDAIQARLAAFGDALETFFGLTLGEVTYHELDGAYLELYGTDALNEAIEQTDGLPAEQALHLILVQHIEPFEGVPVWGISPGAPGVPIFTGNRASAMGLAVQDVHDATADALTITHEFGHFVGLVHTTAIDGTYVDPVPDTPQCPDISVGSLQACPDADNLMFPAYYATTGGQGVVVTDLQRRVLQGSPIYRAYAAPVGRVAEDREWPLPRVAHRWGADPSQGAVACGHSVARFGG